MGSEVEEHITKKYEIKKRLGKGVSISLHAWTKVERPIIININIIIIIIIVIIMVNF